MLVFTHIPKTAGTTLTQILIREYGTKMLSVIPGKDNVYSCKELKRDLLLYPDLQCLSGHSLKPYFDFSNMEKKMQWFTFLRDPVQTFISLYIHQYTGRYSEYKIEFSEWMSKYNRKNRMVSWIAGENNLEKAINIIEEKFEFIGITEKFDESVILLKDKFKLTSVDYTPKMKTRDSNLKEDILSNMDKYKDQVYSNNDLDLMLYDYCIHKIFPEQVKKFGENKLSMELYQFNKRKDLHSKVKSQAIINEFLFKAKRNLLYKPFVVINSVFSR
jgi:hypothetical protein